MQAPPLQSKVRRGVLVTIAGCASFAVIVAVISIWTLRLSVTKNTYVSGLGADGEPTSAAFNQSLLLLSVGGLTLAACAFMISRREGSDSSRRTALWRGFVNPPTMIAASSMCFFIASRVPCTFECPVPGSLLFTTQDSIHLTTAIAGFAYACIGMIMASTSRSSRSLRLWSAIAAGTVALCASLGGLMALTGNLGGHGSWLEFIAMTLAIVWLLGYCCALVLGSGKQSAPRAARRQSRA